MSDAERGCARPDMAEPSSTLELQHLRSHSASRSHTTNDDRSEHPHELTLYEEYLTVQERFWRRFTGKDRAIPVPGWLESIKNIVFASCK